MDIVVRQHDNGPDDWHGRPGVDEGARVLVVDDDHSIRETLRLLLEDDGYQVVEAGDGMDALDLLRVEGVSYIALLDLSMPQLDGAGLLGIVAEDPELARRHSFILMTANTCAMSCLFTAHLARLSVPLLSKPFDMDDLLDLVEQAQMRLAASQQFAGHVVASLDDSSDSSRTSGDDPFVG
jgi:chemosensory pili system protein ChpA (sensor histidine kinase/response regulator)